MKQDVGSLPTARSQALGARTPVLHEPTVARLLQTIGSIRATVFLDQLQADLTSALNALGAAADSVDRPGIQRATHCLVALAGTVGAAELEHAARALNQDAHASDGVDLRDRAPVVAALTARLVAAINALRASRQPVERPQE